jgi:hypothetical protein
LLSTVVSVLDFIYRYLPQWQDLLGILGWFDGCVVMVRAESAKSLDQPTYNQAANCGYSIQPNYGTENVIGNHFWATIVHRRA